MARSLKAFMDAPSFITVKGSMGTNSLPRVTFVLATLNEARRIDACLSSIRAQDYPQELIAILVADGRSTDDTVARCVRYGAQVFDNPLVRCEPGVAAMIQKVEAGLITVIAADNALVGAQWLRSMVAPFRNEDTVAAFCSVAHDSRQGGLTNRYLNRFTDPFNHFVYWDGADYANLKTTCRRFLVRESNGVMYFRFDALHCPLIALAQGVTVRAPCTRAANTEEDDVAPLAALAENGLAAYVSNVRVQHSSVRGFWHCVQKYAGRFRCKLLPASAQIALARSLNRARAVRRALWPLYALSFVGPISTGLVMATWRREPLWLYHPIITTAFAFCLFYETVRASPNLVSAWLRPAFKE